MEERNQNKITCSIMYKNKYQYLINFVLKKIQENKNLFNIFREHYNWNKFKRT